MIFLWLICVFLYLGLGLGWAYYRWRTFFRTESKYYNAQRHRFIFFHRIAGKDIPEHLKFEWRSHVEGDSRLKSFPPVLSDYEGRFIVNIIFWPISLSSALIQHLYGISIKR